MKGLLSVYNFLKCEKMLMICAKRCSGATTASEAGGEFGVACHAVESYRISPPLEPGSLEYFTKLLIPANEVDVGVGGVVGLTRGSA